MIHQQMENMLVQKLAITCPCERGPFSRPCVVAFIADRRTEAFPFLRLSILARSFSDSRDAKVQRELSQLHSGLERSSTPVFDKGSFKSAPKPLFE